MKNHEMQIFALCIQILALVVILLKKSLQIGYFGCSEVPDSLSVNDVQDR